MNCTQNINGSALLPPYNTSSIPTTFLEAIIQLGYTESQFILAAVCYLLLLLGVFIYNIFFIISYCKLKNEQPIKSRGCSILVLTIFLFIYVLNYALAPLILLVYPSVNYPAFFCIYDFYWTGMVVNVSITLIVARTIRFFFALSIYRYQKWTKISSVMIEMERETIVRSDEEECSKVLQEMLDQVEFETSNSAKKKKFRSAQRRHQQQLRNFKLLTSDLFVWIIVGISLLFHFALVTVITAVDYQHCGIYFTSIYYIFGAIGQGFCIILMITDALLNYKVLFRCKLRYFLFEDDRFLFRLEFILLCMYGVYLTVCGCVVNIIPVVRKFMMIEYPIVGILLQFTHVTAMSFVVGGFVLLTTFIWKCKGQSKYNEAQIQASLQTLTTAHVTGKVQYTHLLEIIASDFNLLTIFKEYCAQEWTLHNVYFYFDCISYKNQFLLMSNIAKLDKARDIFEHYLMNSNIELNVRAAQKEKVRLAIESAQDGTSPISPLLFDELLMEVQLDIKETLQRFLFSTDLSQYLSGALLKQNMLEP